MRRLIAWLLALANQDPPTVWRTDFYALKDRLCRRFGEKDGFDVQRIIDECWGDYHTGCGKHCERCGGSGIYRKRVVLLDRWKIGDRVFHRPAGDIYHDCIVTIEGRIRHKPRNVYACREALLWLALIFDRRLFVKLIRSSGGYVGAKRPLSLLQRVVFETRYAYLNSNLWRRSCYDCNRRIFRPFTRGIAYRCSMCERVYRAMRAVDPDFDLPF